MFSNIQYDIFMLTEVYVNKITFFSVPVQVFHLQDGVLNNNKHTDVIINVLIIILNIAKLQFPVLWKLFFLKISRR